MNSPPAALDPVSAALLRRTGVVFVEAGHARQPELAMQAIDLELAALGHAASTRLRTALARLDDGALQRWRDFVCGALMAQRGADRKHEPLFRRFPAGVPDDTAALWWKKVLVHFFAAPNQACLFCRRIGTTEVLRPCQHVVCNHCFDGSNYSACPICEHHVDRNAPFFAPTPTPPEPRVPERIRYVLLDLADDRERAVLGLLGGLLARTQALSPVDRADLVAVVDELRERVLPWLPETIAVRESAATVFGTLLRTCDPMAIVPAARQHLRTATDVLRLVAVYSGADAALGGETRACLARREQPERWGPKVVEALASARASSRSANVQVAIHSHRFKLAKLRRPLRRALLELLEHLDADALVEDMLRHRSYWVWVGEFLHPHEYANRYPKTARAFAIVRGKAPDGTPAPVFHGFYARLEQAVARRDAPALADLLATRPGELARRLDHALRIAGDPDQADHVAARFEAVLARVSTPVLVTLASGLPRRRAPLPVRVYFPKGGTVTGIASDDHRPPLPHATIDRVVTAVEAELLARFATRPGFDHAIVDDALRTIVVPFNERTASPSAVVLPRGSVVDVDRDDIVRMFVHWCEPATGGFATDLDLSVGLYDAQWRHIGVCSYYQLRMTDAEGREIARSSGDLRDAPFPDGASEFVDLELERARAAGVRWAVMVVNAYSGMTFSSLERAFAGIMLRKDAGGAHFDPRTVALKFALQGEHGVFMPMVFDLVDGRLHWIDAYAKGQFAFNNVATSNRAITKICPDLVAYFASGVRMSMHELALMHAAARARRVVLRGQHSVVLEREADEPAQWFLARLRARAGAAPVGPAMPTGPVLALLMRGDLDLAEGSSSYALFRERTPTTLQASDLLAAEGSTSASGR